MVKLIINPHLLLFFGCSKLIVYNIWKEGKGYAWIIFTDPLGEILGSKVTFSFICLAWHLVIYGRYSNVSEKQTVHCSRGLD